eukprot:COSAG01_NODE_37307_length_505_cov_0.940887_1_plen_80_part_01
MMPPPWMQAGPPPGMPPGMAPGMPPGMPPPNMMRGPAQLIAPRMGGAAAPRPAEQTEKYTVFVSKIGDMDDVLISRLLSL